MSMIALLQCLKSARWPTDNPFSIFPGVDLDVNNANVSQSSPLPLLKEVSSFSHRSLETLMKQLSVPKAQQTQFVRVAGMLPHLEISITNVSALQLTIALTRQNQTNRGKQSQQVSSSDTFRVWAPKFPKPQTESFFVIVAAADERKDEIIALRRVGWPTTSSSSFSSSAEDNRPTRGGGSRKPRNAPSLQTRSVLKLPPAKEETEREKERIVDVVIVSDAYIGMTWNIKGVHLPAPASDAPSPAVLVLENGGGAEK